MSWPTGDMDLCYGGKLPISTQKKADLITLCTKGIIPDEFHGYFMTLKTDSKTKDTVPVDSDETESE